jgi:hypothetical protein
MKTSLNWKKGFFKSTYEIFNYSMPAGMLKPKTWSYSADSELNGKKYFFKSKGFFKQKTEIIDTAKNVIIGEISYNSWRHKASIEYSGKLINFKFINFWNTKWNLSDDKGIIISYSGNSSKGIIETDDQNDILVLTGLYIACHFWQRNRAAAAT